jgi:hypothetical protein
LYRIADEKQNGGLSSSKNKMADLKAVETKWRT